MRYALTVHILLIEDHRTVAGNIREFLEMQNYTVTVSHDGNEGLEKAMTEKIDLLILDINLPGMDGFVICTMLRRQGKTMPILMLTARSAQQEMVKGLNIGADDYLVKPFDLDVLRARVRALLRRNPPEKTAILRSGTLELNTESRVLTQAGKKIDLSPKEYALLAFLLEHQGRVQDRPTILERVWGNGDALMFSNTVDVHVAFLRRKIGKNAIQTVPNKGYMIPDSA